MNDVDEEDSADAAKNHPQFSVRRNRLRQHFHAVILPALNRTMPIGSRHEQQKHAETRSDPIYILVKKHSAPDTGRKQQSDQHHPANTMQGIRCHYTTPRSRKNA